MELKQHIVRRMTQAHESGHLEDIEKPRRAPDGRLLIGENANGAGSGRRKEQHGPGAERSWPEHH